MKRLAVLLMVVMIMCVGCGGGKDSSDQKHSFDVKTLASELKDGIKFEDELNESNDKVFFMKYDISEDKVTSQSTYFSTNATTEEIAVVECKDESSAADMKAAFEKRIKEQKDTFESYAPDEVSRLDKAVVKVLGKYAVLCVTADTDQANKIIEKY